MGLLARRAQPRRLTAGPPALAAGRTGAGSLAQRASEIASPESALAASITGYQRFAPRPAHLPIKTGGGVESRTPNARFSFQGRMPTYEYVCNECHQHFEVVQPFSAKPLRRHAVCGGEVKKIFHARGIVFKGSGFYTTDSKPRSSSRSPVSSSDGSSGKADQASSGADGAKPAAKPAASSSESSGSSAKNAEKSSED